MKRKVEPEGERDMGTFNFREGAEVPWLRGYH